MYKRVLLLVGFFGISVATFAFHHTAYAADYYVDYTNGNDSNVGSVELPLKNHPWMNTFTGSLTLSPGDTVYMKRGEQWVTSDVSGPFITIDETTSGTAGNYITTTAYGSGGDNQPLIYVDSAYLTGHAVILSRGASYIVLDNLHIKNVTGGSGYGINLMDSNSGDDYSHDWVITNNEIEDVVVGINSATNNTYNITIGDENATTIATQTEYSNHIHDVGSAGVFLPGRNPTTGVSNNKVYYNYIHDGLQTDCADFEYGILFGSWDYTVARPTYVYARYNRIENFDVHEGIDSHGSDYTWIENNYVYNTAGNINVGYSPSSANGVNDHYFVNNNILENPVTPTCSARAFLLVHGNDDGTSGVVAQINDNKVFFTTRDASEIYTGIHIAGGYESVEIQGNEIYNGGPSASSTSIDGILLTSIGSTLSGSIDISDNYIHDWGLRGIVYDTLSISTTPTITIHNNFVKAPYPFVARTNYPLVGPVNMYNNVLLGEVSRVLSTGAINEGGSLNAYNNIMGFSSSISAYNIFSANSVATTTRMSFDKNLYFNNTNSSYPFWVGPTSDYRITWPQWVAKGLDVNSLYPNVDPVVASSSSITPSDFTPLWNSPLIDTGTDVSLTSDYAGNPIYGLPDIGAYEYQPPYTMGTNDPDVDADVRVYGDGKFRNTDTPGGTTASLSITPQSSTTTEYLDVSITTWDTSGNYAKAWTETSDTHALITAHTIGDLDPGTSYQVVYTKQGGDPITLESSITADESGEISFTYDAGYSQVTFAITDVTPPVRSNPSPTSTFTAATRSVTLQLTTDESATCKYSTTAGTAYASMTGSFTTSNGTTHTASLIDLSSGLSYTYYVRCQDAVSNANTTDYLIAFTIASPGGGGGHTTHASTTTTNTNDAATTDQHQEQQDPTNQSEGQQEEDVQQSDTTPSVTFFQGDQDPMITILQQHLNRLGFIIASTGPGSAGNETDYFGSLTLSALLRFQEVNNLFEEEGTFGPLTQSLLITTPTPQTTQPSSLFTTPLYYGLESDDVTRLQTLLASHPDLYPEGLITGYFGTLTQQAVQRFQLAYHVVSSPSDPGYGYVGPKTRAMLNEVFGQ